MKFIEEIENTGKIPTYHLENEIEDLVKIDKKKPSSRIIRTKSGKRALAALMIIEKEHNHSWYHELKKIAENNGDKLALFYRGTKIAFQEMFDNADKIAKSLVQLGVEKGDEIPACLSNTPEMVYILLAANKIGVKINAFGSHFNKEYIKMILNNCSNKLFLGTDNMYDDIEDIVRDKKYNTKVLISIADSLPKHPELTDEYEKDLDQYYHYENRVGEFKNRDSEIISFFDFMDIGKNCTKEVPDCGDLETEFLVTYTSGSTNTDFPKAMVHTNRSLITCGKFHEPELSGNPRINGLRGMAHIHTESNTNIITCISDNLMQLWSVALEPEYDQYKFLDYLFINKPNYVNATKSFITRAAKQYLLDGKFHQDGKGRKLSFLLALFAVGEGTSKGEEKLINKFLRKSSAGSGVKIKGLSLPYTTLSVGGGDCEHGGIYYTLWKSLMEKVNKPRLKKKEYGMKPVPYAHVSAFSPNTDGTYSECNYNEYGIIASNSATTTKGYKNNPEATKGLIISDTDGRDWVSNNVYGYIDELGNAHVKGRVGNELMMSDGSLIPPYMIEDVVNKDTKNILSCVVTHYDNEDTCIPVINLEFQPYKSKDKTQIIQSVIDRCSNILPEEVTENMVFREFSTIDSFPLTGSGKRSNVAITNMGLENTYKMINGSIVKAEIQNKEKTQKTLSKTN